MKEEEGENMRVCFGFLMSQILSPLGGVLNGNFFYMIVLCPYTHQEVFMCVKSNAAYLVLCAHLQRSDGQMSPYKNLLPPFSCHFNS